MSPEWWAVRLAVRDLQKSLEHWRDVMATTGLPVRVLRPPVRPLPRPRGPVAIPRKVKVGA